MKIIFHRYFKKDYNRLKSADQKRFNERLIIFSKNSFDSVLKNHYLHGKYKGYRSINITGNLRAIYKFSGNDEYIFIAIDSHSNLYS